jgi:hypothetical protein
VFGLVFRPDVGPVSNVSAMATRCDDDDDDDDSITRPQSHRESVMFCLKPSVDKKINSKSYDYSGQRRAQLSLIDDVRARYCSLVSRSSQSSRLFFSHKKPACRTDATPAAEASRLSRRCSNIPTTISRVPVTVSLVRASPTTSQKSRTRKTPVPKVRKGKRTKEKQCHHSPCCPYLSCTTTPDYFLLSRFCISRSINFFGLLQIENSL